jgi:hypothetical protein
MPKTLRFVPSLTWLAPLLVCAGCGGSTTSIETDGGSHDAIATHEDSGAHLRDAATSDGAKPAVHDDGGSDACPVLPAGTKVQCGQSCAFPGYFAPCPSDPGNPIGVSCEQEGDAGMVWECSEG